MNHDSAIIMRLQVRDLPEQLNMGLTDELADKFGAMFAGELDAWWATHTEGAPSAGGAQQRTKVVSCRPVVFTEHDQLTAGSGALALLLSYPSQLQTVCWPQWAFQWPRWHNGGRLYSAPQPWEVLDST